METMIFLGVMIIGVICFKNSVSANWKEFIEIFSQEV